MLELEEQNCKVTAVNVRAEQHGDTPVPACDVGIQFSTGCTILDRFEKGLSAAFYTDEEKKSRQKPVPGTEPPLEGPRLRFNGTLGAFNIKKEGIGYKAELVWGDLAGSVKVKLANVKVSKVKADPQDGGTVDMALQLQCRPTEDAYGKLASLIGRDSVELTLTPPSASELKKLQKEAAKKKDEDEEGGAGNE